MPGHQCHHCKQWVAEGEPHDCWTTTEAALTSELSDDLRDAWERLREAAVSLGEQRIYASHHSIMFARRACYFFVRPKRQHLELCIFLAQPLKASQVHRAMPASRTKFANLVRIVHRDQVEPPITDWIAEAYEHVEKPRATSAAEPRTRKRPAQDGRAGKAGKAAGGAGVSARSPVKKKKKQQQQQQQTKQAAAAATRTPKRTR